MTEGKAEPDARAAGTMVGQSPNMGLGEEREGKVNWKHFGPIELGKKIIIQRKEQCDLIIANYYCNYYYCKCFLVLDCQYPLERKGRHSRALYVKETRGRQTEVSPSSKKEGKSNFTLGTKGLVLGQVESGDLKRKQLF